jgi:hypothetical protein
LGGKAKIEYYNVTISTYIIRDNIVIWSLSCGVTKDVKERKEVSKSKWVGQKSATRNRRGKGKKNKEEEKIISIRVMVMILVSLCFIKESW